MDDHHVNICNKMNKNKGKKSLGGAEGGGESYFSNDTSLPTFYQGKPILSKPVTEFKSELSHELRWSGQAESCEGTWTGRRK